MQRGRDPCHEFATGVKKITTTPALFGDVLEYEGKRRCEYEGGSNERSTDGKDR